MYVQEIIKKRGIKKYKTVLIRESYRDGKTIRNRTVANISSLPEECIERIKNFFCHKDKSSVYLDEIKQVQVLDSKEYGAAQACMQIVRETQLDKIIYSSKIPWREDALAMIVGRIIYPGSKLSLANMFADTVLWELCGHMPGVKPNVDVHCYHSLDQLLTRQEAIQKSFSEKHLRDGCVVLYDITSSYFEGEYEDSDLVTYGYNRDCKRGHEQVNIGLLTNGDGCPVAVEVFAGNTTDQVTVKEQVKKIVEKFHVEEVIFVGDRGMLTPKRIAEVNAQGFKTVTALTHTQMQDLLERGVISTDLFIKGQFPEASDPANSAIRYILCFNQERGKHETATRWALIDKTQSLLQQLAKSKKKRKEKDIGSSVGKIWAKYKTEKFFSWSVEDQKLHYCLKSSVIAQEALLDGCYVIRTEVSSQVMSALEVVKTYKKLTQVEQAFRVIKTTALEIRPIYHQLDNRIRAHVFLCMLAYYLQWHMNQRLAPIFSADEKGKNRRWTFSQVIERLKTIRSQTVKIADMVIERVITTPDQEQRVLIDALNVRM